MHFTRVLLLLALAALPAAAKNFEMKLERRSRVVNKETGDIAVAPIYNGTDWVTTVDLGGQKLVVQIDTGSADLWLASTLLPQDLIASNFSENTLYDPSKSKTWKESPGYVFNISYNVGDLGASGIVGTETINIGGADVTEFHIGLATDMFGQGIIETFYDGTFGLGWQAQNTIQSLDGEPQPQKTFMEAVQDELDEEVFTCDFKAQHAASLSFGFVNRTLYTGDLIEIPINNADNFWSVDDVVFSSGDTKLGTGQGINILMDTGGVGTTTDQAIARDYWGLVDGSQLEDGYWLFPCNTSPLPDLTLNFGDSGSATIAGLMLNGSAIDLQNSSGYCIGGVQATANGHANVGFGFFSTYFTVWDQNKPALSYAEYSNVDDTVALDAENLPTDNGSPLITGSPPTGTRTSSSGVAPTPAPVKAWGLGLGVVAGGLVAAL